MAKKKNEPDKLAQEVSQAIAAGMSYGKWKAMQPIENAEDKERENWTTCEYCGKAFKPKKGKRFCNVECQKLAYSERSRK